MIKPILLIFIFKYSKGNKQKITIDQFNVSLISKKKLNKDNLKAVIDLVANYSSQSEFISISQDSNTTTINLLSKFKNLNNINELNKILKKSLRKSFRNTSEIILKYLRNSLRMQVYTMLQ